MRKYEGLFFVSLFCLLFVVVSCVSYKKEFYLRMQGKTALFDASDENSVRFQAGDELLITINEVDEPSVAYDYNLPFSPPVVTMNKENGNYVNQDRQTYLVTKEGYINFPVLGLIKVEGYTVSELEKYIKECINVFLKIEPIVTVRLMNFTVTILGEVVCPGTYFIHKDRINIIEALALAKDMTAYGKRNEVKLIRTMPNGRIKIVRLDISKSQIVSSPYFYLHQNDEIYVVPSFSKAISVNIVPKVGIFSSIISTLLAVVNTIALLINNGK